MGRAGKEFPPSVIEYAFRKSEGGCEMCHSHDRVEVHHILPIWVAAEYFPQLASWALIMAQNAQCLCHECHVKVHQDNDMETFFAQANYLLSICGEQMF